MKLKPIPWHNEMQTLNREAAYEENPRIMRAAYIFGALLNWAILIGIIYFIVWLAT